MQYLERVTIPEDIRRILTTISNSHFGGKVPSFDEWLRFTYFADGIRLAWWAGYTWVRCAQDTRDFPESLRSMLEQSHSPIADRLLGPCAGQAPIADYIDAGISRIQMEWENQQDIN